MSKQRTARKPRRKKKKKVDKLRLAITLGLIAVLALSARKLFVLEMQRQELQKENVALIEQRDSLQNELKSVNSKEYIEKRAKEQLRLVNPDEILFVFPDDED